MSNKNSNIQHQGIVKSVDNNEVSVMFVSTSACASCHAKGVCSVSDIKEKEIVIANSLETYTIGEKVLVELKQSLGFRAVFYAYILPFLIILLSLIVLTSLKVNELYAGLISLSLLIPFYLILYLLKDSLKKTYSFQIRKTQNIK